jgi:hypothetical protein
MLEAELVVLVAFEALVLGEMILARMAEPLICSDRTPAPGVLRVDEGPVESAEGLVTGGLFDSCGSLSA